MKHKHADLIHAWADGAEIQYFDDDLQQWVDEKPEWHYDFKYRIKPEEKKPVVRWLWATKFAGDSEWGISTSFFTSGEMVAVMTDYIGAQYMQLEWSRTEFPE